MAVGHATDIRVTEARPQCLEPLSTTQNTRPADAYGSVLMTSDTSSENGAIPVVGAMVPISRAWWTS
jgi:hypothetical protein